MGGVVNSAKNFVKSPTRVLSAVGTGGLSEINRKIMPGVAGLQQNADNWLSGNGQPNAYVPGPFGLDPAQMARDKADITGLGEKQYQDTLGAIGTNSVAQTQRAKDLFGQMLPNIAENAQAAHLYDSTGYGQEVGRQQSNIASQIASEEAQQKMAALTGRQGFETGALQRGQSLEDFINQANIAKTLGAQMAPQAPTAKQNFSTVAQGVGALAPWANVGRTSGQDNYYNALAKKTAGA